jgi:hypothetical protein
MTAEDARLAARRAYAGISKQRNYTAKYAPGFGSNRFGRISGFP